MTSNEACRLAQRTHLWGAKTRFASCEITIRRRNVEFRHPRLSKPLIRSGMTAASVKVVYEAERVILA